MTNFSSTYITIKMLLYSTTSTNIPHLRAIRETRLKWLVVLLIIAYEEMVRQKMDKLNRSLIIPGLNF